MAVVQEGCRQSGELDENSEGITVMAIDIACQVEGPFWRLIHSHWAMEGLDSLEHGRRDAGLAGCAYILRVSPVLDCARWERGKGAAAPRR